MPKLHLAASAVVTVFLLALVAILAGPAFELAGFGDGRGLQAGTLPQFVVVAVAVLSILSLLGDLLKWHLERRGEIDPGEAVASAGDAFVLGGGVLVLLAAYVFAWRPLPFPVVTIAFMSLVTLLIAPPAERRGRGLIRIALISVIFSGAVWLVFTHLLKVPLR